MSAVPKVVRSYVTSEGRTPFDDWIRKLKDRGAIARIFQRIDRVRVGNFGDCRSVGSGVYELRVQFGPGRSTKTMPTKDYNELLFEQLQDPEISAEYLSVALEEGSTKEFLLALRNVAEAHGGVGVLSTITDLNRQSMYKMLSEDGNPTLTSLLSVLRSVGITIKFTSDEKEAA